LNKFSCSLSLGDNTDRVAQEFSQMHNLSDKMFEKLKNMLKQQMNGILSRINEEECEEGGDNTCDSQII
jgi:hypothetical protein